MSTPVSSIALVFTASFIGSFGAVFLKLGAAHLTRNVRLLLANWRLALGVTLYLISFVFYYLGLKQGELSVLYPMVALGYIWTILWSRLFFGEQVTRRKILGLVLIIGGVVLLKISN